jgi:hypothetical protein
MQTVINWLDSRQKGPRELVRGITMTQATCDVTDYWETQLLFVDVKPANTDQSLPTILCLCN